MAFLQGWAGKHAGGDYGTAQRKLGRFLMAVSEDGDGLINPADGEGNILPEFASCPALYVNELTGREPAPNAVFADDTGQLGLVTARVLKMTAGVKEGDEITVDYGDGYSFLRSWPRWIHGDQSPAASPRKRKAGEGCL